MKSEYQKWQSKNRSGLILPRWNGSDFAPDLYLDLPDSPHARICKSGRRIKAAANGTYFVKRYSHTGFLKSLLHIFTPSRPHLGLSGSLRAKAAGIATPEVIAAVREKKYGILPYRDWLITSDLGKNADFSSELPLTKELAKNLTALVVTLHNAGMIHGDAQLRNLYRDTAAGKWGVIDLDGCRLFSHPVSRRNRRKELARLASSFSRMAVFKNISLDWDVPAEFAKYYRELCGMDLDDAAYRKRFHYLDKRIRKS